MHSLTITDLNEKLPQLEALLGVEFKAKELLLNACVHSSYVNEHHDDGIEHNERLEFLGDAVLELVTTEYLYAQFPDKEEGILTSLRAALVKGPHLADVAIALGIGAFLLLSHGEEKSAGREKKYILANTMEAIIGALYLDQGFDAAKHFVNRVILTNLEAIIAQGAHVDPKSKLQEVAQQKMDITPTYTVLSEEGPDHSKVYTVGAYLGNNMVGQGAGSSKQKGQQSAAADALEKLGW